MFERHRITHDQLADLASGAYTPALMRLLRAGQLSRQLLLIRHLADVAPSDEALAVLDAARERDPEAAGWVITDPGVAAWTAHAVRKLHEKQPQEADLGQLVAVAAAAAARAGIDVDLEMSGHGATVMIPTVGLIDSSGPLRLRVRSGRLGVAGRQQELPRLTAGDEPARSITLDDITPYRDTYHAPARPRLEESDVERWQELFAGGWAILDRHEDRQAIRTAELVRTIVPLREAEGRLMHSATARHVFGAIGTTMPSSNVGMAVTLVHEGSHSVLNGLLQLKTLFDPKDEALYFAPWRPDPRPIWGLFHGVFAFLAVADMTNRLRSEPAQEEAAEKQFAKVRGQLRVAVDALMDAPSLTDSGRQFAHRLEARLTRLEAVDVSRSAAEFAARSLDAELTGWRKRNGRTG